MIKPTHFFATLLLLISTTIGLFAQGNYTINLASLGGQSLTKETLHNYSILNSGNNSELVVLRASIKFRSSKSVINYQHQVSLRPGLNQMRDLTRNVSFTFSSNSLEHLFKKHGKMPNGEYEYCIDLYKTGGEGVNALASDCIFEENEDLFLINLMEPEDKAKIDELFPMFSWTVNSPLINELNYKIRVAEIKDGQRAANAVMRNRPMYEQSGLRFPTQNYPVTARQLEYWQPYAWTIDAYYKDILMGSAESWEFVIVNDSLMHGVPQSSTHLDIRNEKGGNKVYALGNLKLKYEVKNTISDILTLALYEGDKELRIPQKEYKMKRGSNKFSIDFRAKPKLKHLKFYKLVIENISHDRYTVLFQYINPEFL